MKVIVVGAGVSGLTAAVSLHDAGCTVSVLEAREHAGGRVRSVRGTSGEYLGDLGPTWVWPTHQPVVRAWMRDLGVIGVPQFEEGLSIVEQGDGPPALMRLPSQEGSIRPDGGPQALVGALGARLPDRTVQRNQTVTEIAVSEAGIVVSAGAGNWTADKIIIAVPPRIAATTIRWDPVLPEHLITSLRNAPTWMAQHAKAVMLFERPFWREQGLSGRILSRVGPMVEVQDHCGQDGTPAALFGFVGVPAAARGAGLEGAISEQVARCFGHDAPPPHSVYVEDWARDRLVATDDDVNGPGAHPTVQPEILRMAHGGGRIVFAGAETATISPGLIEGAFVAGQHAAAMVLNG